LVEASIRPKPSVSFQRDVVYSTVAGYYFVRLTDDLMDGEPVAAPVVPLLIVLHAEFEETYHRHFPASHAFWDVLARSSYQVAEAVARAGPSGSIAEWLVSEGYQWGMRQLAPWMTDLKAAARELESPALVAYLEGRDRALLATWERLRGEMESLRRLARSLKAARGDVGSSAAGVELGD